MHRSTPPEKKANISRSREEPRCKEQRRTERAGESEDGRVPTGRARELDTVNDVNNQRGKVSNFGLDQFLHDHLQPLFHTRTNAHTHTRVHTHWHIYIFMGTLLTFLTQLLTLSLKEPM